jgi:hypothetical protein
MRNDNRARGKRAQKALRRAYGRSEVRLEPDCAVIDALTDLRHFCDTMQLDFGNCDRIAHDHYLSELAEAREENTK